MSELPSTRLPVSNWVKLKLSTSLRDSIADLERQKRHYSELLPDSMLNTLRAYDSEQSEEEHMCEVKKIIKSGSYDAIACEFTRFIIESPSKGEGEGWFSLSFESGGLNSLRTFIESNDEFRSLLDILAEFIHEEDVHIFFGGYPEFVCSWYRNEWASQEEEESKGTS